MINLPDRHFDALYIFVYNDLGECQLDVEEESGMTKCTCAGAVFLLMAGALRAAETPTTSPESQPAFALKVDGEVSKALSLTAKAIGKMPHQSATVTEHDGTKATYSGVALRDVLLQAGVPIGPGELRGKNQGLFVVAEGSDGYTVVIALPEVDADFTDATILIADQRNGEKLDAKSGVVKLIVPEDKKQGRWVRGLVALHVRRI
jgi:DMSO/TMAO reductase YedYZ molybdopterin-dependent catalytic subunit